MANKALSCVLLLYFVWFVQSYLTNTAEDIMECYKKSTAIPSSETDCNSVIMKDQDYRCCYFTKTARDGDKLTKKSCARLFYDEDTIRDCRDRLRDEYKAISIICSSRKMVSYGATIIMILSLFF